MTTQSGRQRAPEAFTKNVYFPTVFTSFALRDPFGGRSRGALHFQKKQKKHWFYNVSDASPGPNTGLAKEHLGLAEVQNHSKRIGFTIVGSSHEDPFMEGLCSRSYIHVYTHVYMNKSISFEAKTCDLRSP